MQEKQAAANENSVSDDRWPDSTKNRSLKDVLFLILYPFISLFLTRDRYAVTVPLTERNNFIRILPKIFFMFLLNRYKKSNTKIIGLQNSFARKYLYRKHVYIKQRIIYALFMSQSYVYRKDHAKFFDMPNYYMCACVCERERALSAFLVTVRGNRSSVRFRTRKNRIGK